MSMLKKGLLIIVSTILFLTFFSNLIFAQTQAAIVQYSDNDYINSVYLEFGGAGTYFTINYDLIINRSSVLRFGETLVELERVLKSLQGCEKSIPHKILH